MPTELRVWRSLMYLPVNVEKYVDQAHTRGADVIQLDLEDSVPRAEKERARTLTETAAARVRRGRARHCRANQRAAVTGGARSRARYPPQRRWGCTHDDRQCFAREVLGELVSEIEQKKGLEIGRTKFIMMIETADAFAGSTRSRARALASSP